jgi:hypothetical protein
MRYEFKIDNDGDAVADVTYRFEFKTNMPNASTAGLPLAYLPGLTFNGKTYDYNLSQTYTLTKIDRNGASVILGNAPVAPARVGPYTTDVNDPANPLDFNSPTKTDPALADARYTALANRAITSVGEVKVFAGPRNDPFFVDLGGIFDGLSIRVPGLSGTPVDALKGINVLSIVLEVPQNEVRNPAHSVIGTWATTSRKQVSFQRVGAGSAVTSGGFVQVARLGNPLVNEVVIGLKDKDRFNASEPKDDVANFANYVVAPSLAKLLNSLYGKSSGAIAKLLEPIDETNRTDLVAAFVTGIPGINAIPRATGAGDMIRTNLDMPSVWPNGRGLTDDVVKTALIVLAQCRVEAYGIGKYGPQTINCNLDDGITADDRTLGGAGQTSTFPYVGIPHSSYGVRGNIQ